MANTKITIFNKWQDYYYTLNNNLMSSFQIAKAINNLFDNFIDIDKNTFISIQFKVKYDTYQFRSVSYLQTVKVTDREDLIEIFTEFWNLLEPEYLPLNITDIVLTYQLIDKDQNIISERKINRSLKETPQTYRFRGLTLPNTMDFTLWGHVLVHTNIYAEVKKDNSKAIYYIQIYEQKLKVILKIKDKILIEFTDQILENGKLNSFKRIVKNTEYIIIDGITQVKMITKQTKFLKPILQSAFISEKFVTLDLETRLIEGVMIPYAASIYNGLEKYSFYLEDYENSDAMLISTIKYLMKAKYNNYKIYIHNFSFFDGVFLLKILSELTTKHIRPVIRDGRIIDLKFSFVNAKEDLNLYFRDSYLLLPSSLSKLAQNFDVELKGNFPYLFVNNSKISLNYEGTVPAREYFVDISQEEYLTYCEAYKNKTWNLKNETRIYCEQDVTTLYQIIRKFQSHIFSLFRLDILKYPTLSSLAFAIYRSNYMNNTQIPLIDGQIFNELKKGYTGGSVDVYKPFGEKVYRYDVNSLYPFAMKNYPMPVGAPIQFEGDIFQISKGSGFDLINQPFGFFEVEVITPTDLKIPLLQTKMQTPTGTKTIAPLGRWTGLYFSEEIYNAMNYGYKFKVIRGFLFKKAYIFNDYVNSIYSLKMNSAKGSPNYTISKLLLNSLYGRFGMNPVSENHLIINSKYSLKYQKENIITNVIDFKNGKELISFFDIKEWGDACSKKPLNISVAISAAVTAWARIHMTQFKTMENFTVYYTDTDSIDVNNSLPEKFIGKELGKMKLEHIFDSACFLAPKVYGGRTPNYEYVKIKGLKNPISYEELLPLLQKDTILKIPQEKWYRNISTANITVKQEIYTLMLQSTKRELIYNTENKFVDTAPLHIEENST